MAKRAKRPSLARQRIIVGLLLCVVAAIAIVTVLLPSRNPTTGAGSVPQRLGHFTTGPVSPTGPVQLGVNLDSGPSPSGLKAFAHLVGVTPTVLMWYQGWGIPLVDPSELEGVVKAGAVPMITWDPIINNTGIPLRAINTGEYDGYIAAAARAARTWGGPLYIRLAHEMNVPGGAFGPGRDGNTARAFVLAWRHIVSIFSRYRATNVSWVWSPNVYCDGRCPFTAFYPGNAWVNWVALDGYNYSSVDGVPWMSFKRIFGPSYAVLERLTSKPVMITETASAGIGGSKANWIRQIGPALKSRFRRVRVLTWFQRVKETDWRVNSSPSALAAFRNLVMSPPFAG